MHALRNMYNMYGVQMKYFQHKLGTCFGEDPEDPEKIRS